MTRAIKLKEHDNLINFMYEPYPYRKLNRLFKEYPFKEEDGFVDIGWKRACFSKGFFYLDAVIYMAWTLSKELLADANANMMACQRNNPDMHYELLCMNAKNYTFSSDIKTKYLRIIRLRLR